MTRSNDVPLGSSLLARFMLDGKRSSNLQLITFKVQVLDS